MFTKRQAGLLLHPTSLPGPEGIGTLGRGCAQWLDWMASTGCTVWQVLPLGPTGYGDSPYQSFSTFAGNPMLVDLHSLVSDGLMDAADVAEGPGGGEVEFGEVIPRKTEALALVAARLDAAGLRSDFEAFAAGEAAWLDDYALFQAIKHAHDGQPWYHWDASLRDRHPAALERVRRDLASELERVAVGQWLFFRQWSRVRSAARSRGISIFGDIPLYVAHDSADVWANRALFELEEDGRSRRMAGVPPDYFSETGQLWGNPIYRWDVHAETGFDWWVERISATLRLVDLLRIDHFRGFADYWSIPGGAPTAETGEWVQGPGRAVFDAIESRLGQVPIIAEDLGDLSPAVYELRDELGLPGMNILQFAFDGEPDNPFVPERIIERSVSYTGTHDNDTTAGWWASADPEERARLVDALAGATPDDVSWALIELTWSTRSWMTIAPVQDVLGLDTTARMNTPGSPSGNWRWRLLPDQLTPELADRLRDLNRSVGRTPVA